MEEKKKEKYGYHKLEVGQKIRVFKTTYNDINFYKFQVLQKNYDKTNSKFYEELRFIKGVDIPNETDIIVNQFVENLRENPNDKYHGIRWYQINDFEMIQSQEQIEKDALNEYNETVDENMIEIDENFLD